ncbi:MAG: type II CAAX prenyl endopeptidase Rce1 family protein [bacterium]
MLYWDKIIRLNYFIIILIAFSLKLITNFAFIVLDVPSQYTANGTVNLLETEVGLPFMLFLIIILFPILETLIFQFLVIEIVFLLRIRLKMKFIVAIMLSALLFAFFHNYSCIYFTFSMLSGVIYAGMYLIGKYKNESAFLYPVSLHVFWNLFAHLAD